MEFDIDFDEASKAWRQNKKHIGNGMFVYTCKFIHSNSKPCNKPIYSNRPKNIYTDIHSHLEIDKYSNNPNSHIFCKQHINRNLFPKK